MENKVSQNPALRLRSTLAAGVLSAIASMLIFLALHQLWIMPIWFVLPLGLALAIPGGLAVGWSYRHLATRLPGGLLRIAALFGLFSLVLAPSLALAQLRPPAVDILEQGGALSISTGQLVIRFLADLLLASTLTGWLAGYAIGRTRPAAWATALTGFLLALGPGHNIPFLGGTPGVGKELALLSAMLFTAAVVLVVSERLLSAAGRTGMAAGSRHTDVRGHLTEDA